MQDTSFNSDELSPPSTPVSDHAHGSPSSDSFSSHETAPNSTTSITCASRPKGPNPKIDPHTKKEICEIGRDGKYLYNRHAREFGKIVKRRSLDPEQFYVSFKKVPNEIKEQWFTLFLEKYSHVGYTREQAFTAFQKHGTEIYKNIVNKMKSKWKKKRIKPHWISKPLWAKWVAYWQDPKVMMRSENASKNRRLGAGGVGASTHAGGSVSFSQKLHILEAQNGGREVNLLDAFVKYNAKKDGNGNIQKDEAGEIIFVHPRKKKVVNDYIAQFREGEVDGETRFDTTNIPFDPNKWIESTGGNRKGHILAFGSEVALFGEESTGQCSHSNKHSQDLTSNQELQRLLEEARRREDEARHREDEARLREEEAIRREQETQAKMEEMMETQRIMHQTQIDMQAQLSRMMSQIIAKRPLSHGS